MRIPATTVFLQPTRQLDDRIQARGVWRLKSRESGRIAFNRLKVFNAF